MENTFTATIKAILQKHFGVDADIVFDNSQLLQYLNEKTRSANKGSKARSSFASLYALYVLIEDYLAKEFDKKGNYSDYEGAVFSRLFIRQRELPFGGALQNHGLNNRVNSEFSKFYPKSDMIPIMRNQEKKRYWVNENLLKIKAGTVRVNIATAVIAIIDEYARTKQDAFQRFIETCEQLQQIEQTSPEKVEEFIAGLLAPNVDARLFEIVSYAILKATYHDINIIWGYSMDELNTENLKLFKTGRTNANDGGIDFVMKPLGRFFQVTETLDFKKYFLDIDKIQKFPITFIIKSDETVEWLSEKIRSNAGKTYPVAAIIDKYMACIEEVINIPMLNQSFRNAVQSGHLNGIMAEIVTQSKVEFNYTAADEIEDTE